MNLSKGSCRCWFHVHEEVLCEAGGEDGLQQRWWHQVGLQCQEAQQLFMLCGQEGTSKDKLDSSFAECWRLQPGARPSVRWMIFAALQYCSGSHSEH